MANQKLAVKTVSHSFIVYYLGWFLVRMLGYLCGMRVRGREHIPSTGPFMLASNHQSNLDPPLLGSFIRRPVFFFAKIELWRNKVLGWMISHMNAFPVKRGAMDREALRISARILESGHGLVFFPEGTRGDGVSFRKPKPGIGMVLKQTTVSVPIIPVYIQNSHRLRKCFWGSTQLSVTFGAPIPAEDIESFLTGKEGYQTLAELVMDRISDLRRDTV